MCSKNVIIISKVCADPCGNGFLPTIHVQSTDHIAQIGLAIRLLFE